MYSILGYMFIHLWLNHVCIKDTEYCAHWRWFNETEVCSMEKYIYSESWMGYTAGPKFC